MFSLLKYHSKRWSKAAEAWKPHTKALNQNFEIVRHQILHINMETIHNHTMVDIIRIQRQIHRYLQNDHKLNIPTTKTIANLIQCFSPIHWWIIQILQIIIISIRAQLLASLVRIRRQRWIYYKNCNSMHCLKCLQSTEA